MNLKTVCLLAASTVSAAFLSVSPGQAAICIGAGSGSCIPANSTEQSVFLDNTGGNSFFGHLGSQNAPNPLTFSTTFAGGVDTANGNATIKVNPNGTFFDLTITAPTGYGFSDLRFFDLANSTGRGNDKHQDLTISAFGTGGLLQTTTFTDFGTSEKRFEVYSSLDMITSVTLASQAGFKQLKQFDVSGFGQLVGNPPGGVPEPSTWAMMLLGFAGLGFAGYRAKQKAVSAI